jgi:hypothetical protein
LQSSGDYQERIRKMIESGSQRLVVNLNHLRAKLGSDGERTPDYALRILNDPLDEVPPYVARSPITNLLMRPMLCCPQRRTQRLRR